MSHDDGVPDLIGRRTARYFAVAVAVTACVLVFGRALSLRYDITVIEHAALYVLGRPEGLMTTMGAVAVLVVGGSILWKIGILSNTGSRRL